MNSLLTLMKKIMNRGYTTVYTMPTIYFKISNMNKINIRPEFYIYLFNRIFSEKIWLGGGNKNINAKRCCVRKINIREFLFFKLFFLNFTLNMPANARQSKAYV